MLDLGPALGQHTEEVLLEMCGYDWEEIGRFKDEGAIQRASGRPLVAATGFKPVTKGL